MADTRDFAVRVEGLAQLRKGLKQVGPDATKELRIVIRDSAKIIAADAARRAPRRSGALAGSIRGTTSGDKGLIRSALPYAPVVQWGGTIRPRGVPIVFKRSGFVTDAIRDDTSVIARELQHGIEAVLERIARSDRVG